MGKDLGFDVVHRGETRDWIPPGRYVFFQRRKEYGGGYWLGQVYDDWFGFVIEEPVSLRQGIEYLMSLRSNESQLGGFHDEQDDFFLRG
ncbi:hypothetical protein SRABI106_01046 [Rahnella aquatilis]|nr:hypothetical protein SRABI106_01046 [Rahnella aquatilis]